MKHIFYILIALLISASFAHSQTINYFGTLTDLDSKRPLSGVTVQATSGGSVVASATTGSDGRYSLKIAPGKDYIIKYIKTGYVSKHVKFEVTKINPELMPPGGKITPAINIDMFSTRSGADFSFLNDEPIVDWYFDGDRMNFDRGQVNKVKKQIDDALKASVAAGAKNDADYNALIQEADGLFGQKKYKEAMQKYVAAIKIPGKATEKYPNDQIIKIDNLLQKKAEEELAYKQSHEKYFNLIKEADLLANNKQYADAIAKYQEASDLDTTQQYPKDRISELQKAQDAAKDKEEYNTLIKRADGFVAQNSLRAARDTYEAALKIFPNEKYPKDQLAMLKTKIDAKMAQLENSKKYNAAIKAGDDLFGQKKYKESLAKYQEALTYESAATYPTQQITKVKSKLAELDKFNQLVADGDKNVGIKDYTTAIKKYDAALALFANDTVQGKKEKAQQLLDALNAQAATKAKFDSLVAAADKKVGLKDFQKAISDYDAALKITADANVQAKRNQAQQMLDANNAAATKALKIKALLASAGEKMLAKEYQGAISKYDSVLVLDTQQADAIKGKAEAQKLLAQTKENKENQKKFDDLVAAADKSYDAKKWKNAETKYLAAKALITENKHVNDRIDAIQAIYKQEERNKQLNENIATLVAQGNDFETKQNWNDAIAKYQDALQLDTTRSDIKDLISAAQQKKQEWEKNQNITRNFAKLKSDGIHLMSTEDWKGAKDKFEAALKIHDDKEITAYLSQIAEKIKNAADEAAILANYNVKMKEGEDFATKKDYKNALTSFQAALDIKKDDATAKSRVEDMQEKISEVANSAADLAKYSKAMKDGKSALEKDDYASAIKSFDDALLAKPLDKDATELKKQAQDKIMALKQQEEKYQGLIALANNAYSVAKKNNNDTTMLLNAKQQYEAAQDVKPKASLPQEKIVEIDQLLRKIKEDNAKNNSADADQKYQEQVNLSKVSAQNEKYQDAIAHLKNAQLIKPKEKYPKKMIAEYQALINKNLANASVEKKYDSLIALADLAFGNVAYKKSIDFYQQALNIKQNEDYPTQQIAKARKALENVATSSDNQKYQAFIKKGDASFIALKYQEAIESYQSALGVKPGDDYATKKIEKINQLLADKKKGDKAKLLADAAYAKYIKAADDLFSQENFVKALDQYKLALSVKPNDVYANSQKQICLAKAKAKTEKTNDILYQKIIAKADQYFKDTNYTHAADLYTRALKLRSNDPYPQEQLDKIKDIQNGNAKEHVNIADLGEQSNISIMEGAALLQKGAEQRKQLKLDAIKKQIHKNEDIVSDQNKQDYQSNLSYQQEVVNINDKADSTYLDHKDEHRQTINNLDQMQQNQEKQQTKRDNFEKGSVLRAQKEVGYVQDDMDNRKKDLTADHTATIEQIKQLRANSDKQLRAERTKHHVEMGTTRNELDKIIDENDKMAAVNDEKEDDRAVTMDQITHNHEKKAHAERQDLTSQAIQTQQSVVKASIKDAESKASKLVIQNQIRDEVRALAANLQRKASQESKQVHDQQLAVDAQLTTAQDQYNKAAAGKDLNRQQTVQQVRQLRQSQDAQMSQRATDQYKSIQGTVSHLETVRKLKEAAEDKQKKDLAAVSENIKAYQISVDQDNQLKQQKEVNDHQATVTHLDIIKDNEDKSKLLKSENVKQNYEDVKGLKASIGEGQQIKVQQLKERKLALQKKINKLEDNSLTFSPEIANNIGDIYPEGVSQEVYIRRDKDGIPVQIITRRFVVIKGHGDIYIRMQTNSGITYSKNGQAITQNGWIQGTQNSNLVKHY